MNWMRNHLSKYWFLQRITIVKGSHPKGTRPLPQPRTEYSYYRDEEQIKYSSFQALSVIAYWCYMLNGPVYFQYYQYIQWEKSSYDVIL